MANSTHTTPQLKSQNLFFTYNSVSHQKVVNEPNQKNMFQIHHPYPSKWHIKNWMRLGTYFKSYSLMLSFKFIDWLTDWFQEKPNELAS